MHENRIFELCICLCSMCRKKTCCTDCMAMIFPPTHFVIFFFRFSSSCLQMLLIYYNVHSHYFSICLLLFLSLFRPRKSEPILCVCIDWECIKYQITDKTTKFISFFFCMSFEIRICFVEKRMILCVSVFHFQGLEIVQKHITSSKIITFKKIIDFFPSENVLFNEMYFFWLKNVLVSISIPIEHREREL